MRRWLPRSLRAEVGNVMNGVDRNHHWQVHLDKRQQELGMMIHASLADLRDAVARLEERTDELAREVKGEPPDASNADHRPEEG